MTDAIHNSPQVGNPFLDTQQPGKAYAISTTKGVTQPSKGPNPLPSSMQHAKTPAGRVLDLASIVINHAKIPAGRVLEFASIATNHVMTTTTTTTAEQGWVEQI